MADRQCADGLTMLCSALTAMLRYRRAYVVSGWTVSAKALSTMTDRFENDHTRHPDWIIETRGCPFCLIDQRICGCPHADRAEDLRAQHYDGMGSE